MHSPLAALVFVLSPSAPIAAQCGTWSTGLAKTNSPIAALDTAVFDAGGGAQIYACGYDAADNFHGYVWRWTGTFWEPIYDVGTGINTVVVKLATGTVGGTPHLFAARFHNGGAQRTILQWDGAVWTQIAVMSSGVNSLQVLDDGSGSALYVTGLFATVNGAPIARVAKWDGANWSGFGAGPSFLPATAAFFQTAAAVELHVGNQGTPLNGDAVERFDGANWIQVGTLPGAVQALTRYDSGAGDELYAGSNSGLHRWNGGGWTNVSGGTERISALTVADLGSGSRLHAVGTFSSIGGTTAANIASFDGTSFTALGSGVTPNTNAFLDRISVLDDGGVTKLVVDAQFDTAGGLATEALAFWDGTDWSVLGVGFNQAVNSLVSYDAGAGETLYATGEFTRAGGAFGGRASIARWNGTNWVGIGDFGSFEYAIAGANTLAGRRLFVTGRFDLAPYWGIAAYDGFAWNPVAGGIHGDGFALLEHDDGSGARLFAGGNFALAQSGPGNRIAAWNGASWDTLAGGTNNIVAALARHDEGSGTQLFAAGSFTLAGGQAANRIARWDGSAWAPLAGGIGNGGVNALASFQGQLYAGGTFTLAGGVTVSYLARWDGAAWSDVPGGGANAAVSALHVHDDGRGAALYVGGSFASIGGITAYNIARFDGASWEPVDGGTSGAVRTIASLDDDGDGDRELFVGGKFLQTGAISSGNFGRIAGCPHYTSFCAGDGSLADHTTPCPCGNDGAAGHGCASGANANGALLGASGATQTDSVVLAGSGFPTTAFGIYLQHDALDDRVFHDGVLCAGGSLLRLRNRTASGGASQFPDPSFAVDATTTLSQRGLVTPGSGATRYYSVFYRSPAATFCPPATANVTNGVRVSW